MQAIRRVGIVKPVAVAEAWWIPGRAVCGQTGMFFVFFSVISRKPLEKTVLRSYFKKQQVNGGCGAVG